MLYTTKVIKSKEDPIVQLREKEKKPNELWGKTKYNECCSYVNKINDPNSY